MKKRLVPAFSPIGGEKRASFVDQLRSELQQIRSNFGRFTGKIRSVNFKTIFFLKFPGVLYEKYVSQALNSDYYSEITDEMKSQWKSNHNGMTVNESLSEYLVEYMGKPMTELLR